MMVAIVGKDDVGGVRGCFTEEREEVGSGRGDGKKESGSQNNSSCAVERGG